MGPAATPGKWTIVTDGIHRQGEARVAQRSTSVRQRPDGTRNLQLPLDRDAVRDPARLADTHHIRQGDPLGLGHAVLCARHHVGNQPFAVLLGDDLIDPRETMLSRMPDAGCRTSATGTRAVWWR